MKVAIFGATFDPPHLGHLEIARVLQEKFAIDKVLFIPAGVPPHKSDREITNARDRFNMAQILAKKLPFAEVLDLEIKREGSSYTIDTIKEVISLYKDDSLYLVIGSDQYNLFNTWKDYKEIIELVNIIVFNRENEEIKDFKDIMEVELRDKFCYDSASDIIKTADDKEISFVRDFNIELSSTDLRNSIKNNIEIKNEVIEEVINYIKEKNLYKKEN